MMHGWQRLARMLVLACCALCALPSCIFGGQTGQDSSVAKGREGCDARSPIRDDDATTELGFSPNQAIAALAGPFTGELRWFETSQMTRVTFSVQYAGNAAELVRQDCGMHLSLPVIARITTDDGLLDETLPATLNASAPDSAQLSVSVAIGALHGSYDDAKPARGDLRIDVQIDGGQSHGIVLLVDTAADGSPVQTTIASWVSP
jgi:hypothetical protein